MAQEHGVGPHIALAAAVSMDDKVRPSMSANSTPYRTTESARVPGAASRMLKPGKHPIRRMMATPLSRRRRTGPVPFSSPSAAPRPTA